MDIIGIDLGTTNSVATIFENDELKHIIFDGDELLPSVVHIDNNGITVGIKAKNIAIISPENTAISIKRKMGSSEEVVLNKKEYSPENISSMILKKIKEEAKKQFGREFKKTVITVPAYFNEKQREATATAVSQAGLELIRIINEPTAAAVSYGIDKNEDKTYAIYDLGGGTFDISIIENSDGLIEVLSTMGDNYLGGDDFDNALADLIWSKSGFDIEKSKKIELKLNQLAEKVKIALSSKDEFEVDEKFFAKKDNTPLHLLVKITKEEFEELINNSIDKTVDLLIEAVDDANIQIEELDGILLTGGSSRIPLISKKIFDKTDILPVLIEDPDKSVSKGALLQGAIIEGKDTDSILVDITPYSLGTSVFDEMQGLTLSKIILKNTPVPTSKTSRYYAISSFQRKYQIDVYQGEDENLSKDVLIGTSFLEIKDPVEEGAVDLTFSLDLNGILKVQAIEINTKEIINAEFKSEILHKVNNKKEIKEEVILTTEDEVILKKIDKALENKDILKEDKEDLIELKEKYLKAKSDKEKQEIEEEIIDTIFFLEE